VYDDYETGPKEVYVEPFPRAGRRVRVSPAGGHHARWRADGRELYCIDPTNSLVAVDVAAAGRELRFSPPRTLFPVGTGHDDLTRPVYAPSPDGQRFLVARSVEDSTPRHMKVLLDWQAMVPGTAGAEGR
jgi:hypothetical protein